MRRSIFALALWLGACGGGDPADDACPTWYPDGDGDGFGDAGAAGVVACAAPRGHVDNALDCDDTNRAIHPDAVEVCDPVDRDEDCNGLADNDDPGFTGATLEARPDADGDGYVDGRVEPTPWCDLPEGWSQQDFLTDCDDDDPFTYPGAAYAEAPVACMTDADGDGWGEAAPADGVAPGSDCDDADPATHPRAVDDSFDGVDQNCDRIDGPTIADDFELAGPDPAVWPHVAGNVAPSVATVGQGNVSLDVFGTGGLLESVPLDTSSCSAIVWHYLGYQSALPAEAPDAGDWLHLEYWDGATWLTLNAWEGGLADSTWHSRYGTLSAPSALHPELRVRFRGAAGTNSDHFYVDDFWLGCSADGDGDGVPDPIDCAPEDAGHWSDCGLCADADGDGYGAGCDRGPDCDDADPAVHPFAPDPLGDGRDTDCSGLDGRGFHDDFEGDFLGTRWTVGGAAGQRVFVAEDRHVSGRRALRVEGTGAVTRVPVDLGACDALVWEYQGKRGPSAPEANDALSFEVRTASGWVAADTWIGGATDLTFALRRGWFSAPGLDGAHLQVRFRGHPGGQADDDWYIDDLRVHCAEDGDGDGVPDVFDCDAGDPDHWADCGACLDADGDGWGAGCDLGADCDDADPTVHPTAPDPAGDGVDGDCDGVDGAPLIFDDFEPTGPDNGTWASVTGNVTTTSAHVGEGARSMDFYGAGGVMESRPVDTSACPLLTWSYLGMIGGAGPADPGDYLFLEYWDGASWQVADRQEGGTDGFGVWSRRGGFLDDPAALRPDFRVRLRGQSTGNNDHFYVDRFELGCAAEDADGDGVPRGVDCDDTDPWHAWDCDRCVDGDGDGFGASCDLGPDCDDGDPAVHPLASDTSRDGVDQDCDLFDGDGALFDDFELGEPDPGVWAVVTGNVAMTGAWAADGGWAADLFGSGGVLESHAYDMSTCPAVAWRYAVMNGGAGAAEPADWLYVERWDGAAWVEIDRWNGAGAAQDVWHTRTGVILDPAAARADFRLRLRGDADTDLDHFYVDRVEVGCTAADNDGDGVPGGLDCDDGDPRHHSDCGVCQDLDGDGYGSRCDLGEDCDDLDPDIHPGAVDDARDGVDQDCDGIDGALLLEDDFEGADGPDPMVWEDVSGNVEAVADPVGARGTVMDFWGAGGELVSRPFDTSSCQQVVWRFLGWTGGPGAADAGDWLFVDFWDGARWIAAAPWEGGQDLDAWKERAGVITAHGAIHAGFRIRLRGDANATNDHFLVDAVRVGCAAPDADGDGRPRNMDCDEDDFWHWSDCGVCVDNDGDGHGPGCDLGGDCDDTNPSVNPAMPDPKDGFDANCDSLDLALLADDFDRGGPDPAVWTSWSGSVAPSAGWRGDGDFTMDFSHDTGVMETVPVDTTGCSTIGWRFVGMTRTASASDALVVEYWNGLGWIPAHTWYGSLDRGWSDRQGVIHDPNAYRADFAVRLRGQALLATRHFHVDEVAVGCLD